MGRNKMKRKYKAETEPVEKEALVAQMCGWMYAEACHYMDIGRDIREVELPEIWEKAQEQMGEKRYK